MAAGSSSCGRVRDIYFDDRAWRIVYLLASLDPRSHRPDRQVLIPPSAIQAFSDEDQSILLHLRPGDLDLAPAASSVLPVCRQYASLAMSSPGASHLRRGVVSADPHLRSARAVTHYKLQFRGESAGVLADLLYDPVSHEIRFLVVEQVIERRRVRFHILPSTVERFSWATQRIHLKHLQPVVLEDTVLPLSPGGDILAA